MKFYLILFFITGVFGITRVTAQDTLKIYNPQANASAQIEEAVQNAKNSNKHILIQVGGNWCSWCRLFYQWSHKTASVDSMIRADYVTVHLNYSKENKNEEMMKKLGFPQRFGFPVFVILNENGALLHTQNSAYLEEAKGYSEKKVLEFLGHWNRAAVSEQSYIKKP